MGITITIKNSKIEGNTRILEESQLPKGSSVNISVEGSNFGDDFNVGNGSKKPNIDLRIGNTSVKGSVNVAEGATNPNVRADIHNDVIADEINIPGTPTEDTNRQTKTSDIGFDGKPPFASEVYHNGYKKATSHPKPNIFGAILEAIAKALDPSNDKGRD